MHQLSYYIGRIDTQIKRVKSIELQAELTESYDAAFSEDKSDAQTLRELRFINERINKAIDAQNMD